MADSTPGDRTPPSCRARTMTGMDQLTRAAERVLNSSPPAFNTPQKTVVCCKRKGAEEEEARTVFIEVPPEAIRKFDSTREELPLLFVRVKDTRILMNMQDLRLFKVVTKNTLVFTENVLCNSWTVRDAPNPAIMPIGQLTPHEVSEEIKRMLMSSAITNANAKRVC